MGRFGAQPYSHLLPAPNRPTFNRFIRPVLGPGPGNIAQAHAHDDWIALDELETGTALSAKLIRHWCC